MEDRELIALGLVAVMLIIGAFLIARRISAKRAFEYRQSGRGKSIND
ncbi:MAG TPA: hypothetical protein PKC48_08110 [Sphingorhabdus sp.]|jgi:hypothetical protein|nr:hypothetical protein [Sphingorhabdus sp.]HMT41106.1 hypothetical protein [Sphingorhabdus sp.]HMU22238.1 hypothetical protein [Sphingorhabdus sp.]